ncbi:MAG: hypothetical protein AAGI38_06555 [Bacteroidota bacterium]
MKKILFIGGSLEAGKDGVGDYTLKFAGALSAVGYEVALLGIYDRNTEVIHYDSILGMPCLRIPAAYPWQQKKELADTFLADFQPEWIEVQFVIYAFHAKGLPFRFLEQFGNWLKDYQPISFMFHEPWIGRAKGESTKRNLIGAAQRTLIKRLIRKVSPKSICTSNSTFQFLLNQIGIEANVLPLFSNIPVHYGVSQKAEQLLLAHGLPPREERLLLVWFGRIPADWKWQQLGESLSRYTGSRHLYLMHMGKASVGDFEKVVARIQEVCPAIQLVKIGSLNEEEVSGVLQCADAGIAITAPQIIGKSGVVAAYLAHGLPVMMAGLDEPIKGLPPLAVDQQEALIPITHNLGKTLDQLPSFQLQHHQLQVHVNRWLDAHQLLSPKSNLPNPQLITP